MFIPVSLLIGVALVILVLLSWACLVAWGRNPLPFPDRGNRIFSAASLPAKEAIVDLLAQHGVHERFQFNSEGVNRSIFWDGTIINQPSPAIVAQLGNATSSIGLVASDPNQAATAAASFLQARGFSAHIVTDAEPALPIVFVVTDALPGTVLNFRKHVIHLPRPTTPR